MAAVEDVYPIVVPICLEQDVNKRKEMAAAAMKEDKLPYWLKKFELRLEENEKRGNKNGFFVGDSFTVADLKVFAAMEYIETVPDVDAGELFKAVPKLPAFVAQMNAIEKIQDFKAMFKVQQEKSPVWTQADPVVTEHIVKGRNVYIEM